MDDRPYHVFGCGVNRATLAAIYFLAAIHVCVIFVAGMPHNPIKAALEPLLRSYTSVLLPQQWSLFAPNPSRRIETIWARSYRPSSAFANVTAILAGPTYQNRLLPSALTLETYSHALARIAKQHDDSYARTVIERTAACAISEPADLIIGKSFAFRLEIRRLVPFRKSRPLIFEQAWEANISDLSC